MQTTAEEQVDLALIDETLRRWRKIKHTFTWGVGLSQEESDELRELRRMRDRRDLADRELVMRTTLRIWELLAKRGG